MFGGTMVVQSLNPQSNRVRAATMSHPEVAGNETRRPAVHS